MTAAPNTDDPRTLVSVQWVRNHISDRNLVLLDASWHMPAAERDPYAEYVDGHIPGARFFDIDAISDTSSPLPHMLPTAEAFAASVSGLGISNADQIIIYDAVGLFSAARAWWMFRAMGHQNVAVMDGGLPAWLASGGTTTDAEEDFEPAPYEAQLNPRAVTSLSAMQAASAGASHVILDARPAGRFDGSQPEPRPGLPSGHMPNATSLPFPNVVTADGCLKSPSDLENLFAGLEVGHKKNIITTCGSGVTAAILTLALARIGVEDTSLYDGSWTQWGSTEGCPIETG
ncbi:3-mercaptopyruvate sulfurtransferase [Candidatus Phaeomarinobacter ectocarpi]|uniref:3-mercaptopyruvate sulfurtransferase n=1 Tax=Candidatus Phaeomarinibacter ectocarpi TaxID=1458461 RepID=UPI0005C57105|nr:3-mercaptopyruvate sulfurtransferase [Candidatus Phaeomarinobacter ectocarpi]